MKFRIQVKKKINIEKQNSLKTKSDKKSIHSKTGTTPKKNKVNPYLVGGIGALGLLYFINKK